MRQELVTPDTTEDRTVAKATQRLTLSKYRIASKPPTCGKQGATYIGFQLQCNLAGVKCVVKENLVSKVIFCQLWCSLRQVAYIVEPQAPPSPPKNPL